jgi:L-threonylcarbamoyladenylate synthase
MDLEGVLGAGMIDRVAGESSDRPLSPGQMPVHYAPSTPAFRVGSLAELQSIMDRENAAVVVIGDAGTVSPQLAKRSFTLASPAMASRDLYDVLHDCDSLGLSFFVVVMPPDRPEWEAVRDRLLRATRPLSDRP